MKKKNARKKAQPAKATGGGGEARRRKTRGPDMDSGAENFPQGREDVAPAKRKDDDLILCSFECEHCQEPMAEVAGYHLSKGCPRCGWENKLDRHETFKCHECGDEFTFPSAQAKEGVWCLECHAEKRIEALGCITWELSPTSEGHPMFATETARMLFGEDEGTMHSPGGSRQEARQGGLYNAYKNATPHGRRKLGFEAKILAEHVLRFMVALAVDFEDYEAVRWLALRADLGKRRFPDDAHQNLETMLTDPKRPRASREWREVRDWVKKGKAGGPKAYSSPLSTILHRLSEKAWWWHFDILNFRKARKNPRMNFSESQMDHERRKWIEFLKQPFWHVIREDESNANVVLKQMPFPERYVSSDDDRACAENLRDEVLMHILKAMRRTREQDWKEDGLPMDDAELKRRVDEFLRLRVKSRGKHGGKRQS